MKKVLNSTTSTVGTVGEAKGELAKPLEDVVVEEGKILKVGTCLTTEVRDGLITFLQQNMEVFVWTYKDMPRINPEDILHYLNVDLTIKPVKQKRRKFAPERNVAIADEVEKLLKAKFI
jgi:hypothetical protein